MAYHRFLKPTQWIVGLFLVVGMCGCGSPAGSEEV